MVRKLAGVVFAVSTLHASVVSALGLGEIELQSGLNQPLQAEIVLNNLGNLNQQQIAVKLAGKDDFARAGVERMYFLNDLTFSVQFDGSGKGVIKVTSKNLVREPYLDFVLEARWPEGRLLREYTLLVDLPIFSEVVVAAPVPAATRRVATTEAPIKARVPAPASSAAALPAAVVASGEIVTRKNDTLWGIASRARPAGASMQQAMMAIYRNNLHAFARQNINGLNRGQVLRLPSAEQFETLSRQQAIQAVAMQNEAWKSGSAAPLQASEIVMEQAAPSAGSEQSYMKLSTVTDGDSSATAASNGVEVSDVEAADGAPGVESMRSELVAAQEKLDRTARDNAELDSRLDELEAQVDTLDKLVALKDSQLAALQSRLEQESGSEVAAVDMNYEASGSVSTVPEQGDQAGLIDRLMSPLSLGGIGVVLLLGVAGLVMGRRRADDDESGETVVDSNAARFKGSEVVTAVVAVDHDVAEELTEAATPSGQETVVAAAQTPRPSTTPGGDKDFDPLTEAEIYCSYDRHDEAVAMLRQAITEQPDRNALQLKLLSILAGLDRRDDFMQAYGKLAATGDEDSLQQARQSVAGKDWLETDNMALVGASIEPSLGDEIDNIEMDFDLDFDLEDVVSLDDKSLDLTVDPLGLAGDEIEFDLGADSNADTGLDLSTDNSTDTTLDLDNLNFDFDLSGDAAAGGLDTTALADMLDTPAAGADDLSEMVNGDEIATKLDLARAYVDMGDVDGARDILEEVLQGGSDTQVQEASELLRDLAG